MLSMVVKQGTDLSLKNSYPTVLILSCFVNINYSKIIITLNELNVLWGEVNVKQEDNETVGKCIKPP
jgi:hypothetical protein